MISKLINQFGSSMIHEYYANYATQSKLKSTYSRFKNYANKPNANANEQLGI